MNESRGMWESEDADMAVLKSTDWLIAVLKYDIGL